VKFAPMALCGIVLIGLQAHPAAARSGLQDLERAVRVQCAAAAGGDLRATTLCLFAERRALNALVLTLRGEGSSSARLPGCIAVMSRTPLGSRVRSLLTCVRTESSA